MCIGTPLQVIEAQPPGSSHAWCADGAQRERLDMRLVGPQPAGTWVLAFQGTARQVMDETEATQARAGRQALAAVLAGEADVDSYFADLIGRSPELPAHLRKATP